MDREGNLNIQYRFWEQKYVNITKSQRHFFKKNDRDVTVFWLANEKGHNSRELINSVANKIIGPKSHDQREVEWDLLALLTISITFWREEINLVILENTGRTPVVRNELSIPLGYLAQAMEVKIEEDDKEQLSRAVNSSLVVMQWLTFKAKESLNLKQ